MSDWYYLKHGEQKGPVAKEFIMELVRNGQLQRTDLVWTEGMKDWMPAESVSDLPLPRFTPPPGSILPSASGLSAADQTVPNYLVWSVLSTVFCCLPSGIVAIVYSTKANTAMELGNLSMAQDASKKAKRWNIVSLIAGLVFGLIYALAVMMPMMAKFTQFLPASE